MTESEKRRDDSKILVLDDDAERAEALGNKLRFMEYEPIVATDRQSPRQLIRARWLAVMLGNVPTSGPLKDLFQRLVASSKNTPIFVLSDADSSFARQLLDHPLWELKTPVRHDQLAQLLKRAELCSKRDRRHRIGGSSATIQNVRRLIEQVAAFDTSVLITGESGTGKELVARAIHDLSDRAEEPFVPINCGAIPSELLESELFGHEKGAFTGAIGARKGRFEMADRGTLFLDEIGDMSIPMQVKVLRVFEERQYERVGSNETRTCNVRLIAATHRNLPAAISEGDFREDLYYRLNVFPIEMPPLRKRTDDLPALLEELMIDHGQDGPPSFRLTPAAMEALANYPWPGNVRELSNLVDRLAILHPSGRIDVGQLPAKYRASRKPDSSPTLFATDTDALPAEDDFHLPEQGLNLKEHLVSVELRLIRQALKDADGVVAQAARLLQMRRTTLVEKLRKYRQDSDTPSEN